MALALLYIFVVAKPISMRRLAALFFLTLIAASFVCAAFGMRHPLNAAFAVTATLTVLIWGAPLVLALNRGARGQIARNVSGTVCWSYSATAVLLVSFLFSAGCGQGESLGLLVRQVSAAALIGLLVQVCFPTFRRNLWCAHHRRVLPTRNPFIASLGALRKRNRRSNFC